MAQIYLSRVGGWLYSDYKASLSSNWNLTGTELGKNLVLYVPRVYSADPLNSKVSNLQSFLRFIDFQALDTKFVLALEPKVLKLEGSSFGIRPFNYVLMGGYDKPPKITPNRDYVLNHCSET